jgi:hypothetical protein
VVKPINYQESSIKSLDTLEKGKESTLADNRRDLLQNLSPKARRSSLYWQVQLHTLIYNQREAQDKLLSNIIQSGIVQFCYRVLPIFLVQFLFRLHYLVRACNLTYPEGGS